LVSTNGEKCGEFSVLRCANDEPLWLDSHVFITSAFAEALADAILRARMQIASHPDWRGVSVFAPEPLPDSLRLAAQGD
jgi:hypothetical protein